MLVTLNRVLKEDWGLLEDDRNLLGHRFINQAHACPKGELGLAILFPPPAAASHWLF